MKSWNSNRVIVSVLLFLIFLFSFLLYLDFKRRVGTGDSEIIGVIRYKEKLIQRKIDGQVIWETVDRDTPITNRDSVRTSDNSTVTIEMNDKTEIEMDENSLILLDFSNQNINLDFAYGALSAKRSDLENKKDSKLNIRSGEKLIELGKSDVKLTKTDEKSLNLTVDKGNVLIKTRAGERQIEKNQFASIQEEKVTVNALPVKLIRPIDKSIFFAGNNLATIQFSWEPQSQAGNDSSILEISEDYKFTKKTKKIQVEEKTNVELNLLGSHYYWRVLTKSKKNKSESSEVRKISVIKEDKIKLFLPLPKAKYTYVNNLPMITFAWKLSEYTSSYKLEIGKDREFKEIIKTVDSFSNRIGVDSISDGNYFARVSANFIIPGISPQKSEPIQFFVEKKVNLEPVEITSLENANATITAIENEKFVLNWKGSSEYNLYEVQISEDNSFQKILQNQKVSKNFLVPRSNLEKRLYYWRVRGITKDSRTSDFSEAKFKIIEPANLELTHPKDNSEFALQLNDKVSFKWRKVDLYGTYRLEISEKSDFSSIEKSESTTSLETSFNGFNPGAYFARVLLMNSQTNEVLLRSKPILFRIPILLTVPVLTHPVKAKVVDMSDSDTIQFNWETVPNAISYKIELFLKLANSEKLLVSETISKNQFRFKNLDLLDEGKFKWRITANIRTKEGKEFTSPPGIENFAISLKASPSSAPEIISPKKQHTDKR